MRIHYTPLFKERLQECPREIGKKFHKQVLYLSRNLRHPSLHAKKYSEAQGIWQARIDRNYRFYFLIEKSAYILLDVRSHPK